MVIKTASLTEEIVAIVKNKGTEKPYSGEYDDFGESGTYLCRQCGLPLFRSQTKFHSGCGWPSFDEEIQGAVLRERDADGYRTEILCSRCRAHLGHVFTGEGMTAKNTRHCVNSLSLDFVADLTVTDTEEAVFAAGCFWGVEHYMKQLPGVLKTEVGYSGGSRKKPTYEEVCSGKTGHFEVIRVIYDPSRVSYEALTKYFFEIHDPTQANGQGPDLGEQYLSVIFYYDEAQKNIAQKLVNQLEHMGYRIATRLLPVSTFWRAEEYHQDYYEKTGKQPYCHRYEKKF
ncbi:Peptide methionine sulfoxide reductase MsrA 3 [Aquicella siphonis]|uniref:Peptide methionine sulfoxide reductase MsrA n=1 Tax=Aquicella siphonis TaxID=254247 RepID=A0A5E4PK05_9COXI|nr:bifunctional methionine sulfoxide reductase B/A protein [Aquicella siphonis]VVC77264.1 Peptide methionine sulfoxide reductase MsrA 3 [Aquicella siphonis]